MPMPLFVFCHGLGGFGKNCWFPDARSFIAEKGVESYAPDFPNSSDPRYEAWKQEMNESLRKQWKGEEIVFVAHSMGGYFIMRFLEETSNELWAVKTVGLVLVAPAATKRPEYRPFYDKAIDFSVLRKFSMKTTLLYSKDDPIIGKEHIELVKAGFGEVPSFSYRETTGWGHFTAYEVPIIKEILNEYISA